MNKVVWSQAYGYFISSENITLRMCAEKFGLNYDSLRQKASKADWTWKREQIFRNALTMMDFRTTEEIAKRNQAQIELARILLMKAGHALKAGLLPQTAKELREWIEVGIKIERICLGLEKPDNKKVKFPNNLLKENKETLSNYKF